MNKSKKIRNWLLRNMECAELYYEQSVTLEDKEYHRGVLNKSRNMWNSSVDLDDLELLSWRPRIMPKSKTKTLDYTRGHNRVVIEYREFKKFIGL